METTYRNRKSAGTRVGGQFTETPRPEDAALSANLRLSDQNGSEEAPRPTVDPKAKVVVKVARGGQVTLKPVDGRWISPTFLSNPDMRMMARWNPTDRKGCREVSQLVVLDLLDKGVIPPEQEVVSAVCKEVALAGRIASMWWPKFKRTDGATGLYHTGGYYDDKMWLSTDTWTPGRVLGAAKTYCYVYEGHQNNPDEHTDTAESARRGAARMIHKAGTLLELYPETRCLLAREIHDDLDGSQSLTDDERMKGKLVVELANHKMEPDGESFLRLGADRAHEMAPAEGDTSWRWDSPVPPFRPDSVRHVVEYVAAHPSTPPDLLEECREISYENGWISDKNDWKKGFEGPYAFDFADLLSCGLHQRDQAVVRLTGRIRMGPPEHVARLIDDLEDYQSRHEAALAEIYPTENASVRKSVDAVTRLAEKLYGATSH